MHEKVKRPFSKKCVSPIPQNAVLIFSLDNERNKIKQTERKQTKVNCVEVNWKEIQWNGLQQIGKQNYIK